MNKRIGIVGHGFLGSYLARRIQDDPALELGFVHDTDPEKLRDIPSSWCVGTLDEGLKNGVHLSVETANARWVRECAASVLEYSDLLIVSVTAFAEDGLREKLDAVAKHYRTKYFISHGAIAGLDGIRDAAALIRKLEITTIRPSEAYAWPNGAKPLQETKRVIYEGSVREACRLFPNNVNLFATVAIHGLGFDRTLCRIVVDPELEIMKHVIEVEGTGISWRIAIEAIPFEGQKKVYVPISFYHTVRRICLKSSGMVLT